MPYGADRVRALHVGRRARGLHGARRPSSGTSARLTFTNNLGALMQRAAGVVAMGGYNTFCEILSFDKRAIIVPRTRPRLEQFIRARAARNVGLIEMLDADRGRDSACHGDGAAPAAAAGPAERRRGAGPARRPGQCLAPGRQAARPSASRPRAARGDLERARRPPRRRPCLRRAPGPDRRDLHAFANATRVSRSCSRASRACPRPSSPRRSPAWRRAALRSRSGRCAGRPTSIVIPCTIACRAASSICRNT